MPTGHGTLVGAPGVNHVHAVAKGFYARSPRNRRDILATAFDIKFVFNRFTLGDDFCRDVWASQRRS